METSALSALIEALVDVESPSEVQFSPDGAWIAFVFGKNNKPDKDKPMPKTLRLLEVSSGKHTPIGGGDGSTNDQPRWSPDGKRIAFVSNRAKPEEAQLLVVDAGGGEAKALTDLRGTVDAPAWLPDGKRISFLYSGTLDKEKKPDADPVVIDAEPPYQRVWVIDVETRELNAVTPENENVHEYAWSPDGTRLVILSGEHPNPMEGWYSAQLYTVDAQSGQKQPLCTMPNQIGRMSWSPDGTQVAFVSGIMSDEGNVSGDLYVVPAAGGDAKCLTPDLDYSITWIEWRDEGILCGGRQLEAAVLAWHDPQTGAQRLISRGMYNTNGFGAQRVSTNSSKRFAAIRSSFTEPANVYVGSLERDEWQQMSDLPIPLPSVTTFGRSEAINRELMPPLHVENMEWVSPDGNPVHGFLVFPPNYESGKCYPLFAHVHGGPSWSYVPSYYSAWERLMIAKGCVVYMPNPRGSWGRGHAYQSANVGDLGGGDWRDINSGVDCLIERGIADPERMAIGGWSYGGYLVTWAITQTDRFRCAIAGASITSYESNYGVVMNREWQTTMFGSNVYDDYELHRSRSPIAFASRVKTPTLLVHGMEDVVAPPQQAIEFYTALKHFNVPSQCVLYPREPHGFRERAHQIDLYQRISEWVDKYLFGEG